VCSVFGGGEQISLLQLKDYKHNSDTMRFEERSHQTQRAGIEWELQNKLPPWMTYISEGADQAIAVVLGQSLNPDGSAPQVLLDRVQKAKDLLSQGLVMKVLVSGGDAAGVGHTEAYNMAQLLVDAGVPASSIIQESQATTTGENAWFMLRWIPNGTGKVYIVTSDFHMPRATYIFQEVFNHFYHMLEQQYKDDPDWTSQEKRYPRLEIIQAPVASFCGTNASMSGDDDPEADINTQSLSKRARDELGYLGDGEVVDSLFGEPRTDQLYIWPIQIDVSKDPENAGNFKRAMAQAMNTAEALCECIGPPESGQPELPYPLTLPAPTTCEIPEKDWMQICPTNQSR